MCFSEWIQLGYLSQRKCKEKYYTNLSCSQKSKINWCLKGFSDSLAPNKGCCFFVVVFLFCFVFLLFLFFVVVFLFSLETTQKGWLFRGSGRTGLPEKCLRAYINKMTDEKHYCFKNLRLFCQSAGNLSHLIERFQAQLFHKLILS